nr:MAG TPA: hypothetical protein [Caudoviricetes sp.]
MVAPPGGGGFEFRFGSTGGKDFVLYINQTSRHLCGKY